MTAYNPLQYCIGHLAQAKGVSPHTPIEAFKFLHRTDLRFWLNDETVKLDSLLSYSSQESRGGRGDPMEIQFKDMHGYLYDSRAPEAQTLIRNLDELGIAKIGAAMDVSVKGQHFVRKNRLVYCLSDALTVDLYRKWRAVEGYDAVVRIPNVQWLIGAIQLTDAHGPCLLGGPAVVDWVEYADTPVDLALVDLTVYKFIKDRSDFSWQRELRMSWPQVVEPTQPPYIVHVPGLSRHVEVISIPGGWLSHS